MSWATSPSQRMDGGRQRSSLGAGGCPPPCFLDEGSCLDGSGILCQVLRLKGSGRFGSLSPDLLGDFRPMEPAPPGYLWMTIGAGREGQDAPHKVEVVSGGGLVAGGSIGLYRSVGGWLAVELIRHEDVVARTNHAAGSGSGRKDSGDQAAPVDLSAEKREESQIPHESMDARVLEVDYNSVSRSGRV